MDLESIKNTIKTEIDEEYYKTLNKNINKIEKDIDAVNTSYKYAYAYDYNFVNNINTIVFNLPYNVEIEKMLINKIRKNKNSSVIILQSKDIIFWEKLIKSLGLTLIVLKTIKGIEKYVNDSKVYDLILLKESKVSVARLNNLNDFIITTEKRNNESFTLSDVFYFMTKERKWNAFISYNINLPLNEFKCKLGLGVYSILYDGRNKFKSDTKYYILNEFNIDKLNYCNLVKSNLSHIYDNLIIKYYNISKYNYVNDDHSLDMLAIREGNGFMFRNEMINSYVDSRMSKEDCDLEEHIKLKTYGSIIDLLFKISKTYTKEEFLLIELIEKTIINYLALDNSSNNEMYDSIISLFNLLIVDKAKTKTFNIFNNDQNKKNITDIQTFLLKEKQILQSIFYRLKQSIQEDDCNICFESYDKEIVILSCCQKGVCFDCSIKSTFKINLNYSTIIEGICPYCSRYINIENDIMKYKINSGSEDIEKLELHTDLKQDDLCNHILNMRSNVKDSKLSYVSLIKDIVTETNIKKIKESVYGMYYVDITKYHIMKNIKLPPKVIIFSNSADYLTYSSYKLKHMKINNLCIRSCSLERYNQMDDLIDKFIDNINVLMIHINKNSSLILYSFYILMTISTDIIFLDWPKYEKDIDYMNILSLIKKNINVHMIQS